MREGLDLDFRAPSPSSTSPHQGDEMYAEVLSLMQILNSKFLNFELLIGFLYQICAKSLNVLV